MMKRTGIGSGLYDVRRGLVSDYRLMRAFGRALIHTQAEIVFIKRISLDLGSLRYSIARKDTQRLQEEDIAQS
jgi:hypothetical protein